MKKLTYVPFTWIASELDRMIDHMGRKKRVEGNNVRKEAG